MMVTVAKWKLDSTVENQNITSAKHILFALHSKSGLIDNAFIFFPVWNILRKHFGWICYKTLMFILPFQFCFCYDSIDAWVYLMISLDLE